MGTSVNHPSPNTPTWRLVSTVLGNINWSPNRQSEEIWQAALADRQGRLTNELGSPLLAEAGQIADTNRDPIIAIESFDNVLSREYASGLVYEMGKRALARAVATGTGSLGFASELFAETVAYYVSRDMPSVVGASDRIKTIRDAGTLKDSIKGLARETARQNGHLYTNAASWPNFVKTVLSALQGQGGPE